MATTEQITALKALLGAASGVYTDIELGAMLDVADSNVNTIAASVWNVYASQTASLVNTSESGSSRSMGDIYKNALAMAKYYADLGTPTPVPAADRPRTRGISRV